LLAALLCWIEGYTWYAAAVSMIPPMDHGHVDPMSFMDAGGASDGHEFGVGASEHHVENDPDLE